MEFLKMLQEVRTPFFTQVFALITYLGDELIFMAVVMAVLWCVDKKWGYRLFALGMMGSIFNQLLKALFLIPRPWVLDTSLKPVASALEGATGYSFPSGHTQSASTLFGGVAVWLKKSAVTILCVLLILVTGFSRMYLGVHTPLDVGVSLGTGLVTVALFAYLFKLEDEGKRHVSAGIGLALLAASLVLLLYVLFAPKTGRNVEQFDVEGVKTAYTVLGAVVGLIVSWLVDRRWLRYEVRAAWWAQALKFLIGIGLLAGLRAVLKAPLLALCGGADIAHGIRYFLVVIAAGVLWPLTFPLWAKTAHKK